MEPLSAPEDENVLNAIALREMLAEKGKSPVANALAPILENVEQQVEQFFQATILSAQRGICTGLFDVLKHGILNQIRAAMFGKTINKDVDK